MDILVANIGTGGTVSGTGKYLKVSRVLGELGIEVVWALARHYDKKYENGDVPPSMKYLLENGVDFEASVADQQNYEVMNVLKKISARSVPVTSSRFERLGYKERNPGCSRLPMST